MRCRSSSSRRGWRAADTADTGIDDDPGPPLGFSDLGIGATHKAKWIQRFGTDRHEEAFVVAPTATGVLVGGVTRGSWFRPITDPCVPTDDTVPDDCGDAVLFDAATLVGIQQGDVLTDSVRGVVVENGFVTFGGAGRRRRDQRGRSGGDGREKAAAVERHGILLEMGSGSFSVRQAIRTVATRPRRSRRRGPAPSATAGSGSGGGASTRASEI